MDTGTDKPLDIADTIQPVRPKTLDYYVVALLVIVPLWSIIGCVLLSLCAGLRDTHTAQDYHGHTFLTCS
jgi:hypothetical protein